MEQQTTLIIEKKGDDNLHFIGENIMITAGNLSFTNGKHQILEPGSAHAKLACNGKTYIVENTGHTTIEDWYWEELLPKKQMLDLLLTDKPVAI